jgi:hypothetical protein
MPLFAKGTCESPSAESSTMLWPHAPMRLQLLLYRDSEAQEHPHGNRPNVLLWIILTCRGLQQKEF